MDSTNVRVVLKETWESMSESELTEALDLVIQGKGIGPDEWVWKNSLLTTHPKETIDPRSLGVHQGWETNLMPFREFDYHGRSIYLFQYHIDELCS